MGVMGVVIIPVAVVANAAENTLFPAKEYSPKPTADPAWRVVTLMVILLTVIDKGTLIKLAYTSLTTPANTEPVMLVGKMCGIHMELTGATAGWAPISAGVRITTPVCPFTEVTSALAPEIGVQAPSSGWR
jgi:hypothetical protein